MDMNIELLTLGGYGYFVWSAFIFTFLCCFSLYLKTKKELNKQEKLFLIEHKKVSVAKLEFAKQKGFSKEVLPGNLTY